METTTSAPEDLPREEARTLRLFLVSMTLVAALCITSGFFGIAFYDRSSIREEMRESARRSFANIVLMRRWSANQGGVFVPKGAGVESNPYLESPEITTVDGKVYTQKNPALMTRELSELLNKEEGFLLHITSLRPLNPVNHPDAQERDALAAFEQGLSETDWEEKIDGVRYYRYMAPLLVEPTCLACHAKQGYRVGDVRGGISVSLKMSEVQEKLQRNSMIVAALATLTIGLVLVFSGLFSRRLVRELANTRRALQRMATTDALTGLINRHALFRRLEEEHARHRRNGRPLSIAMVDVDHFKLVNDAHGHPAGDAVLKDTAQALQAELRGYDLASRFGGEEFLIVLPETGLLEALRVSERIRQAIESRVRVGSGAEPRGVTASFGVASLGEGEEIVALIHRADAALCRAKSEGRNRVAADEPEP